MDFLYFILIGLAAGWLAGQVMEGKDYGLLGDLCIGVVGAVLGGAIFRLLDIRAYSELGVFVMAFAGACLLLFILRKMKT